MRVVAIGNKNSGPFYHRVILPMWSMADVDVRVGFGFDKLLFDKPVDIVMYNRDLREDIMAELKGLQKTHGFKFVVDVDDFWELDSFHVLSQEYKRSDYATIQIKHISEADLVFTTHSRLAEAIEPYNPNVHVLPNAIPHRGQFDIEREESEFVRLFWQGSNTHQKDIEILEMPIDRLNKLSRQIKMIFGGMIEVGMVVNGHTITEEDETLYIMRHMALIYTAGLKHQYKLLPVEPITSYYSMYKHADICLTPLVHSPFNRMKSNLKILEAANLALPVIASQVHPYLDMPVRYCMRGTDWVEHIKDLVANPEKRLDEGERLKAFCDDNFSFDKINTHRKQILEYAAKGQAIFRG